jgi:hypothetical protein
LLARWRDWPQRCEPLDAALSFWSAVGCCRRGPCNTDGMSSPLSLPQPTVGQELNATSPPWAGMGYGGAYDPTKAYAPQTLVTFNGGLYAARLRPNSPGPTPAGSQPDESPTVWAPLPAL